MLRNPVVIGIDQVLVHMQMNLVNKNNDTLQETFVEGKIWQCYGSLSENFNAIKTFPAALGRDYFF